MAHRASGRETKRRDRDEVQGRGLTSSSFTASCGGGGREFGEEFGGPSSLIENGKPRNHADRSHLPTGGITPKWGLIENGGGGLVVASPFSCTLIRMDIYLGTASILLVVILAISGGMLAVTIVRRIGWLEAEVKDIHEREAQNEDAMQSIIHSLSYRIGVLEDQRRQEDQCRDRD